MIALNLDLLSVGICAAGIGLLGFTIYFNGRGSVTNRTFLAFAIITIAWSIANYLQYQPSSPQTGLWIVRIITALGCWHALTFFQLCYVFPEASVSFPRWYKMALLPFVGFVSILTLTPLVFQQVSTTSGTGVVTGIHNGPAIPLFGILVIALIVGGIFQLVRRALKNTAERRQIGLMALGTFLTFIFIVTFNLILPAAFNNPRFLPLSALFIFPLIACTAYSIFRYHLFDIKVLATEIVAFLLSIATLVQIIFSTDWTMRLFQVSVFGLVLAFSILMVRSVIHEVELRELTQKQEKELEDINEQQTSLLHFVSHEVKGYLTKNEAAFAAISTGDFGDISPSLKSMSAAALSDTRRGVDTVIDILDASNLKKGTMAFNNHPFDLAKAVENVVADLQSTAHDKGVILTFDKPAEDFIFSGDEQKIRHHVLRNVIDNSIKYTPQGSITISMAKEDGIFRIIVADTGVGITPEDMPKIFKEGGHGKDSIKVNVHSTGYGLYIAKQVVEAHGGTIHAESEGAGKGSQFIIEFPAN